MFVLARALTYATLFVGLVLVFLPAQLLPSPGIARPETIGGLELVGMAVAAGGAAIALWCILTFAVVGRLTPTSAKVRREILLNMLDLPEPVPPASATTVWSTPSARRSRTLATAVAILPKTLSSRRAPDTSSARARSSARTRKTASWLVMSAS